jgi:hypothetical protein
MTRIVMLQFWFCPNTFWWDGAHGTTRFHFGLNETTTVTGPVLELSIIEFGYEQGHTNLSCILTNHENLLIEWKYSTAYSKPFLLPIHLSHGSLWYSSFSWSLLANLHQPVAPKSLSWWGKVDISLIVQHSLSRAVPVGRKRGIRVGCNLFW